MSELYQVLADSVREWRASGYACKYPVISEILEYAVENEREDLPFPASGDLRYLRAPQLRALETYWYLRLVQGTPRIEALYEDLFGRPSERRKALGAIIATEFAMALEHAAADVQFVENALVFAPGKTILEALRDLTRVPYERILPPRLYKQFAATHRIVFTRDGDPDIPVVIGSSFNVVVTNTEKIRIQARSARRSSALAVQNELLEERSREEANRRLSAIASLPHLAVFSDEAQHTYGQEVGQRLKRVRQTVDYLHARSPNLICVVNTTGTPYFGRQPLKDVVVWYGLGQGIADGILKEVAGNIQSFEFRNDQAADFVEHVVRDFFGDYKAASLPDGTPAKLAMYFPQTDDLDELRPHVELVSTECGIPTTAVLAHTSKTGKDAEDAFNRLSDPASPHRVVLLVNKGTEGWNCPSLFATALARRLTSRGNNFVLQAASRCLRQVPGNDRPARIYLSADNRAILDRQLQETYGESIADLDRRLRETKRDRIHLNVTKAEIPALVVRRPRSFRERVLAPAEELVLRRPPAMRAPEIHGTIFDVGIQVSSRKVLRAVGEIVIEAAADAIDRYAAAVALAANTRADVASILDALASAYGTEDIPVADLDRLEEQLEGRVSSYRVVEVEEEVALQLIKLDGFERERLSDGSMGYAADISYPSDRADIVIGPERLVRENSAGYGFHYTPYNFDTHPEASYFEQLVRALDRDGARVTDIYFTGAVTSSSKTDLRFEYRRRDGKIGEYTPDFVVRCGDGRWLLIEVKRGAVADDELEGRNGRKAEAVRDLVRRNPGALKYDIVFTDSDSVTTSDLEKARAFARDCGGA